VEGGAYFAGGDPTKLNQRVHDIFIDHD